MDVKRAPVIVPALSKTMNFLVVYEWDENQLPMYLHLALSLQYVIHKFCNFRSYTYFCFTLFVAHIHCSILIDHTW